MPAKAVDELRVTKTDQLTHIYAQKGGAWHYRAFPPARPLWSIQSDLEQGRDDPATWPVQEPPAEAKAPTEEELAATPGHEAPPPTPAPQGQPLAEQPPGQGVEILPAEQGESPEQGASHFRGRKGR